MKVRFRNRAGSGAALLVLLALFASLAAAAAERSAVTASRQKLHPSTALAQVISDFDSPGLSAGRKNSPRAQAVSTIPGLDAEAAKSFSDRFRTEIWPLLNSPDHNCVGCHNASNLSALHFLPNSSDSFRMLVEKGYLDPTSPTSLLARIFPSKPELMMPPAPGQSFSPHETGTLRVFMDDLHASLRTVSGAPLDERFPIELLAPYRGKPYDGGADNSFLTYYQLRGKIRTIFGDDWQRNDQDLWETYIDLFHGADFHLRFNESAHPSTEFLAGVDLLSKDVSARSYLTATGPFSNWPSSVPAPLSPVPSPLYQKLIVQLYNRTLYRPPSEAEVLDSYRLIRSIYQERAAVAARTSTMGFTVTATDPAGLSTSRDLAIPVSTEPYALYEQYVDETKEPPATTLDPAASKVNSVVLASEAAKKAAARSATLKTPDKPRRGRYNNRGSASLAALPLDQALRLAKDDPGQVLRIDNSDTNGNVSVAGVTLVGPLPSQESLHIPVTDPSVTVDGAWDQRTDGQVTSYEDGDHNKGASSISIPLVVPTTGEYRVFLEWRKGSMADNAPAVLVEALHHGVDHLAMKTVPDLPPPGEARFTIDETEDDIDFWDLKTRFRFSRPGDGVELTNAGTRRRVVADAVRLVPPTGDPLLLPGDKADGHENWALFDAGEFHPYNTTGPVLYDDSGKAKGKLTLLYRPQIAGDQFNPSELYRVEVGVPGHVDNETQAPVIVHATESSPIVQVAHPSRAHIGARVYLDASGSYNLQRTPLHFRWIQTGGPRVELEGNVQGPRVHFVVQPMGAQQAAWEGLCSALIRSPDFLFSRPPTLATERQPAIRRRLQLVKITQDLLARSPTLEEIARLDRGAPLTSFVDADLNSPEFQAFYTRRIRLYLESHGSVVDDEPVRLWTYIAFHDLPFQQILTADYSVDPAMHKVSRPAYYGHSGLLTMKGFIQGKPGLPHFNYAAQVCEKFLGKVFIVPPSIVSMRKGSTAASTTDPSSVCYTCHKLLTPLAFQRSAWSDNGDYTPYEPKATAVPAVFKGKKKAAVMPAILPDSTHGDPVDDSDHGLVHSYPFRGKGMEAFAMAAQRKEAFIRTVIQTHFSFFFGRAMRYDGDERGLYRRLWLETQRDHFAIRPLIRTMLTSDTYLNGSPPPRTQSTTVVALRSARKRERG